LWFNFHSISESISSVKTEQPEPGLRAGGPNQDLLLGGQVLGVVGEEVALRGSGREKTGKQPKTDDPVDSRTKALRR